MEDGSDVLRAAIRLISGREGFGGETEGTGGWATGLVAALGG